MYYISVLFGFYVNSYSKDHIFVYLGEFHHVTAWKQRVKSTNIMMRANISNINHYSEIHFSEISHIQVLIKKLSKRISVKMILMSQKQFFSLFISCMIVVSKYTIIATECYQCDSVHHENCTLDWTEEDVMGHTYDQYIQQCTNLCTQKLGKPLSLTIWTKLYKSSCFKYLKITVWTSGDTVKFLLSMVVMIKRYLYILYICHISNRYLSTNYWPGWIHFKKILLVN